MTETVIEEGEVHIADEGSRRFLVRGTGKLFLSHGCYDLEVAVVDRGEVQVDGGKNISVTAHDHACVHITSQGEKVRVKAHDMSKVWASEAVVHAHDLARVWAKGGEVVAYDQSRVKMENYGHVTAYGRSEVILCDGSRAKVQDTVEVNTFGEAEVIAEGEALVWARWRSNIRAFGKVVVHAGGECAVRAADHAVVFVKSHSRCEVWAEGSAHVIVGENYMAEEGVLIEAHDRAIIDAEGVCRVDAHDYSIVRTATPETVTIHDSTVALIRVEK